MNIIIVLIVLIVLGGGGFYLFKMEQKRGAEEKRVADIEAKIMDTTKFITYNECNYSGFSIEHSDQEGAGGMDPPAKSMIIPQGFTVDTYTKPDKGGVKLSFTGPVAYECLSTPIPYFEWKRK